MYYDWLGIRQREYEFAGSYWFVWKAIKSDNDSKHFITTAGLEDRKDITSLLHVTTKLQVNLFTIMYIY